MIAFERYKNLFSSHITQHDLLKLNAQVRFRSLAESSDVESVLAEYDGLKEQNEALKKFCSSMEQLILKLKNDLNKCVEEKSTVMAENAKLESDLADSSRLTEFLREQVNCKNFQFLCSV